MKKSVKNKPIDKTKKKKSNILKRLIHQFEKTKVKEEHVKKIREHFKKLEKDNKNKLKKISHSCPNNKGKVLTGIKGFDKFFGKGGGICTGTSVLVEGGPGSGKTIFCLNTLENLCKQGKKCLYMSFEEPEENLITHMENFGWKPREHIKKGLLRISRFDAIDVSRSIEALLSAAKKELRIEIDPVFFPKDFEPDFIVIDSLTSIASAFSGESSRFRIYMEQLFRYLEKNKITNFLIREVSSPSHIGTIFQEQGEAVSFLSDGIIVIYNVIYNTGERGSAIEILKMRGTNFKKKIVEMKIIDKKGIEVQFNKILNRKKKGFELT
jgi:circadian clock protein KaiC